MLRQTLGLASGWTGRLRTISNFIKEHQSVLEGIRCLLMDHNKLIQLALPGWRVH
jgi:hypothetical protein